MYYRLRDSDMMKSQSTIEDCVAVVWDIGQTIELKFFLWFFLLRVLKVTWSEYGHSKNPDLKVHDSVLVYSGTMIRVAESRVLAGNTHFASFKIREVLKSGIVFVNIWHCGIVGSHPEEVCHFKTCTWVFQAFIPHPIRNCYSSPNSVSIILCQVTYLVIVEERLDYFGFRTLSMFSFGIRDFLWASINMIILVFASHCNHLLQDICNNKCNSHWVQKNIINRWIMIMIIIISICVVQNSTWSKNLITRDKPANI